MFSDKAASTTGNKGIVFGIMGALIAGTAMSGVSNALGDNPVDAAIANHSEIASGTDSFIENANAAELLETLRSQGVPAGLSIAPDLTEAHLVLEGGMQVAGDRQGVALRYRDGDGKGEHVYVLQSYFELPGSRTTDHSRHIGHNLMRGYKAADGSAAVWSDYGSTFVFTGHGDEEQILDVAAKAFFGMTGGGGGHH